MLEEWRDIEGFPGYKVSNMGRVWSDKRNRDMKLKSINKSYHWVNLFVIPKKITIRVDKLVASAFLGYDENDVVIHRNGDKRDDRVDNLLPINKDDILDRINEVTLVESGEEFVDLSGVDDVLISNCGRFFSTKTFVFLVPAMTENGYENFVTKRNGKQYMALVHRLVADYFVERRSLDETIVHHKDGNKTNNHASNLEWVTPSQNTQAAMVNMPSSFKRNELRHDAARKLLVGEEIRKCCVGGEGKYGVTSFGRVYSYRQKIWMRSAENSNGYMRVELRENKKRKSCMLHRLVAHSFVDENYYTDMEVNHIDGDRKNNRADNLDRVTTSQNASRRYHRQKCNVSGKRKSAMSNDDLVKIRELYATGNYTYKQIGAMYDVRLQTISNVVNKHGCYKNR